MSTVRHQPITWANVYPDESISILISLMLEHFEMPAILPGYITEIRLSQNQPFYTKRILILAWKHLYSEKVHEYNNVFNCILWSCPLHDIWNSIWMYLTESYWLQFILESGNKALPDHMTRRIYDAIWPHQVKRLCKWWDHSNGLVQDCSNSSALALELLQSCAEPSIESSIIWWYFVLMGKKWRNIKYLKKTQL